MKKLTLFLGIFFGIVLSSCGGGGGSGSGAVAAGSGAVSSAKSNLCDDLSGLEAVYWDFINGSIRTDLPSTAFTIPFNIQGTYSNSISLLLGFTVPQGWNARDAVDVSGFAFPSTVVGADLIRADNQAVWRYMLNAQITGGFTSASILDSEINAALSFMGNPTVSNEQCGVNLQQAGFLGPESIAIKVVRAGDFTIMARAHVTIVTGVSSFYDAYVSVARTSENTTLINDIFIPMITQLYGGGSDPAACEDGQDNDADGQVDYPADAQCSSPSDNTE